MRIYPIKLLENNIFLEKTRQELLKKQKRETPQRVQRAGAYSVSKIQIESEALINDWLVITTNITGNGRTYTDMIAFKNVMTDLIEVAKNDSSHTVNSKLIIKSIHRSLDKNDIYIDCSCPDFCLHPNTKIKLLNNTVVTVKELKELFDNNEELWVYSVDENGEFKPGKVLDVFITKKEKEFIEITLDNDEKILTTKNHKYMLRNGDYCEAESLKIGQSLMPLYFKKNKSGYEQVKSNVNLKSWYSTYKIVSQEIYPNLTKEVFNRCGEKEVAIHHIDYNKLNNYPSNLKPMGVKEHIKFHAKFISDRWKYDKNFQKAMKKNIDKLNDKRWNGPNNIEERKKIGRMFKNYHANLSQDEKIKRKKLYQTPEHRSKLSKALKNVWNSYSDKERHKRNEISRINLNGKYNEKSSKRMKKYWANLSNEEYKNRCEIAKKAAILDSKNISKRQLEYWKNMDDIQKNERLNKTFRNPTNKKLANIGKMKKVIQYLIDNNIDVTEENYNKYKKFAPNILTYFNNFEELLKECKYNHKIKNIKHIIFDEPIEVYDLTVDKYENFYVDAGVILHNCYRYAYWSTQGNFKWGRLQNSNGKKIRNPNNQIGSMCKHLYALLRSNKFLNSVSDKIMRTIMANLDVLVKRFNIDISEFKVNSAAYDKMLRMNITRDKQGRFIKDTSNTPNKKDDNENDQNKEENNT